MAGKSWLGLPPTPLTVLPAFFIEIAKMCLHGGALPAHRYCMSEVDI